MMVLDVGKKGLKLFLLGVRRIVFALHAVQEVSILAYHSIGKADVDTAITPEVFERHLMLLKESGADFVSLQDIVAWHQRKQELPTRAVAITFDDGYVDFETVVLPITEKWGIPVAVFVVGDEERSRSMLLNDIPLMTPEAITRLRTHPLVEIGYHSSTHKNLSLLQGEALIRECTPPSPMRFFAYPGGSLVYDTTQAVAACGYEGGFTIKAVLVSPREHRFALPRSVIMRDMNDTDVFAQTTIVASWYDTIRRALKV